MHYVMIQFDVVDDNTYDVWRHYAGMSTTIYDSYYHG